MAKAGGGTMRDSEYKLNDQISEVEKSRNSIL